MTSISFRRPLPYAPVLSFFASASMRRLMFHC